MRTEVRIRNALLALLALLAIVEGVFLFNTLRLVAANRWVAHTLRTQRELASLQEAIEAAQSNARAYALTSEPLFSDALNRARAHARKHFDELGALTAESPEQQSRLGEMRRAADAVFAFEDEVVRQRDRFGMERAAQYVGTREGERLTTDTRARIRALEQAEGSLLATRRARADSSTRATYTAGAVSAILFLGIALTLYQFIRHDIAVRRRTESSLKELARRLERSNRELQDFALVASHDLQEPLRKIQMFGDRLQMDYGGALPEAGRDYVLRMQAAAARGQELIRGLLAFSRVTTRAQPPQRVDLGMTAKEVVADLEARIGESGARVDIGPLPTIDADPLQMRQLFQNLIGNALKFRRPGVPPEVRVAADRASPPTAEQSPPESEERPQQVTIRVSDNGIGFDEKYAERIFGLFQRLHERSAYEGTGMGLAICRKIAERHGGSIVARSSPGAGTTFLVTLPVRAAAAPGEGT